MISKTLTVVNPVSYTHLEPDEVWEERIEELTPYKVTKAVMDLAGPKAIFLHLSLIHIL